MSPPGSGTLICPVCFSDRFEDFNGRTAARCSGCGSLERGRLAWMTLSRLGLLRPGVRFLNLAPEPFMLTHGRRIIGDSYVAADYDPDSFPAAWRRSIVPVDVCQDRLPFERGSFEVVMHSHVLEHVMCSVAEVVTRIDSLLADGGWHVCAIPISAGSSEEDLSVRSPEERARRFGQHDHVRRFGADFKDVLGVESDFLKLGVLFDAHELETWRVPPTVLTTSSGHSVLAWRRAVNVDR
jgi:hypothetical protein